MRRLAEAAALVAALAIGGCTDAGTSTGTDSAPQPVDQSLSGDTVHIPAGGLRGAREVAGDPANCGPDLLAQYPWLRCVIDAQGRVLAVTSSSASSVAALLGADQGGCPTPPIAQPGDPQSPPYTGPCTIVREAGGAFRVFDGNGVLIMGGTP